MGERLARLALNQTYGMCHIAQHGPTPVSAKEIKGKLIIEFSNAAGLKTSDGKGLRGLEIGWAFGSLQEIPSENIKFEDNRIIIEGYNNSHRVRYAWKPYTDANLVNEAGLPASTFEIEVKNRMHRKTTF